MGPGLKVWGVIRKFRNVRRRCYRRLHNHRRRGIVWRVVAPDAEPAAKIHPVVTGHMPALRNLNAEAQMKFGAKFDPDALVRQ